MLIVCYLFTAYTTGTVVNMYTYMCVYITLKHIMRSTVDKYEGSAVSITLALHALLFMCLAVLRCNLMPVVLSMEKMRGWPEIAGLLVTNPSAAS